ncbi:glycogen debranching N-terminal domain-containing protein [Georgenia sp. SYP-B2076]|uniref:amylo-alpha-1,6-glucosidase n=1 Tax=Georgenia sp. SYP-B2076 TaxID=2495881 RepID=UPI000F8EA3F7|nr:glycogen debranching N-terminal domain-containing protein [Georgenia sp. SYP-B2076]
MTQTQTHIRRPVRVTGATVTLLEGSSFCLSTPCGDIEHGLTQGLFYRDTRLLSRWELRVDDEPVEALTVLGEDTYKATFVGRARPLTGLADSTLLVERHRFVGAGMREDLVLRNLGREATACQVTVRLEADFGDLFEVKQGRPRDRGHHSVAHDDGVIRLRRDWHEHSHEVRIIAPGATTGSDHLTYRALVPARGMWCTTIQVAPVVDGEEPPQSFPQGQAIEETAAALRRRAWLGATPRIDVPDEAVRTTLARSTGDLGALQIQDPARPELPVVAAGAPWFMALFGRDSIITSLMTVSMERSLALGTAETLAAHQGGGVDPLTEEQPGRIVHEIRFGVNGSVALGANRYFGTADATPLFVMLVGELLRWGADPDRVRALMPHVDRALDWVVRHGDADGDGFVEYQRATDRGLLNQGWKDSFDGITYANGRIPEGPVATCEVQAYVYAAYRSRALLAEVLDGAGAGRPWYQRAAELRRAFNERFWLPERGWYALALDGEKRPVDALASNMGHALWTGIVDTDKAPAVAELLLSPEMFSGWGVRTLASSMGAYNPMSYHNGSVWPHDNAIIAGGLRRYGFDGHAQRVASAILTAAEAFDGRLPELICGFDRSEYAAPVPYPTACSPQAWASAAPLELVRVLLGAEACVPHGCLRLDPAVPPELEPLRLHGVPIAGTRVDVEVTNGSAVVTGLPAGIRVVDEGCDCMTPA